MGTVTYEANPGMHIREAVREALELRDVLPDPWVTLIFNGVAVEINMRDRTSTVLDKIQDAQTLDVARAYWRQKAIEMEADRDRLLAATETIKPVEDRAECSVCHVGVIIDGGPCGNCAGKGRPADLTQLEVDQVRIITRLGNFVMAVSSALDDYKNAR